MYQLDNFALLATDKEHLAYVAKWINNDLFFSINTKKHKINIKTVDILLSQLQKNTQVLIITMNKEVVGFCEFYNLDYHNRVSCINIFIEDGEQNFVLHGFKIVGMICTYLYNIIGVNKISTEILLENSMTINIFKQRGFKIEVHKRAHRNVEGSYKTVVELSLLKSEAKI